MQSQITGLPQRFAAHGRITALPNFCTYGCTGALQIDPDPGKPSVFSVYTYINPLNKQDVTITTVQAEIGRAKSIPVDY